MRARLVHSVALQISVGAVYLAAAKAGLALASLVPQITLIWPPTGIALAAVVLLGFRVWPAIALAAFLANLSTAEPPLTAAGIALGNTLEALVGGALLDRIGFRASLGRLRDAAALVVLGAGLSTMVSATIGVGSLCAGGMQPWGRFAGLWVLWWFGDAGGDLVVAPLLLTWALRPWRRWSRRQRVEVAALWAAACGVGVIVFGHPIVESGHALPLEYLAFPIVILSALRHGPPVASLSVLTTMVFALADTLLGAGPFARRSSTESLVLLQLYTSVLALTGLLLGALARERMRFDRQRAAAHATASLVAESAPLERISERVLGAICANLDWDTGVCWGVDRSAGVLRCLGVWSRPGFDASEFVDARRSLVFAPGVGLPGRVWAGGSAIWIPDVARDASFPQAAAAGHAGLHAAFGFPIRIGAEVEAVLEFFSSAVEEPDEPLLQAMDTVGAQLGQLLERRRAEERLQQSQRELAERVAELAEGDRRKDEFLAMLAHELRNPLAPIGAAAEILGDVESADPSVERVRAILDRQVQHMVKLIDDLLDVSRISRRQIRLERADVALATVVEHALEVSRGAIEARGHKLEVALPAERVVLHADLIRLAQVVANLLNNAAKFTEPGGSIRLEAQHGGGELVLRVRDDGVGIDPKLLPRVFDLFFQAATTPDRAHGGLGIGLTLVRTLVEMHGGRVDAASDGPGRGSEFTVRLPARADGRTAASTGAAPLPSARPLRILLVEDHEASAEASADLLRRRGHEIHVARDGVEGLSRAHAVRPDVVLLDIGLPGLDGYEVARRLRGSGEAEGVLLVAVSGYGQDTDRRRAFEAGFDHHLVKPVKIEELTRILARAQPLAPER